MKKTFFLLVALILGSSLLPAQGDNQWELFQSLDWYGRQAYLDKGTPATWSDGFLVQVLKLVDEARIESGDDQVIAAKKSIAVRVIRLIGDRPVVAAVGTLAGLQVQYRDPMVRGEAWLALAKLGNRPSIPALVRALAALNESSQRGRSEEIQAAYEIQALGLLKATEGFRAVAAATQGWYSPASGVKALAKRTLALVATDVDTSLNQLLANDEDLVLLEGMFQYILDQDNAVKSAQAASSLLGSLVRVIPHDKEAQDRTFRLILAAQSAAQKVAAPPVSLVVPLKTLLVKNEVDQEMIQAIQLLAKIDDPSALAVLVDLMKKYNDQQKSATNSARDLTMVRETIQALSLTGKAGARSVLEEAKFSDYTPGVTRDVTEALAKLPRD